MFSNLHGTGAGRPEDLKKNRDQNSTNGKKRKIRSKLQNVIKEINSRM